jgi:hypothetical protein
MKTRIGLTVLAGALALGTSAFATSTDDAVTGSHGGFVGDLGTINATYSDMFLKNSDGSGQACLPGIDSRFHIARAHARHQLMFDTLLAAKLSGRPVEVFYQNVSNTCWVKRVIIKG